MSLLENRNIRLVDWSGNVDFGRGEVVVPRSEEDVVSLVRLCRDSGKKLRVIGLRTSWNALWYCKDVMMVSDELDAIREIDPENRTITCEPGVTLTTLHQRLWEQGLSLDCAPGIDWVTVGGAISTGSHGSGHRSISSSLVACRLVTADGEVLEIGEGDDRLDAVRISQGMLGVLTSVTLRAVPRYHVHVKRTRIPTQDWRRFLTEGEMSYALCFPYTETTAMVRVDVIPDAEEAARIVASLRGEDAANPRQTEVAPGPSEESPFSPAETMKAVCALANLDPSTFPARNRYLLDVYFPDAEHAGPAHELLMSYRSEPIAGAEWAVPVDRFDAFLADLRGEIAKGDLFLPIMWFKKVKGETAWLAAADGDCVQCGVYHNVIPGTPSLVKQTTMRIERLMLKHGGRPHLGKLILMSPEELRSLYPRWAEFDALRRRMDPEGMFWTESLEARFGSSTNS